MISQHPQLPALGLSNSLSGIMKGVIEASPFPYWLLVDSRGGAVIALTYAPTAETIRFQWTVPNPWSYWWLSVNSVGHKQMIKQSNKEKSTIRRKRPVGKREGWKLGGRGQGEGWGRREQPECIIHILILSNDKFINITLLKVQKRFIILEISQMKSYKIYSGGYSVQDSDPTRWTTKPWNISYVILDSLAFCINMVEKQ